MGGPRGGRAVGGRVRSLKSAATFVDAVGIALAFPAPDLVLPSLWEAAVGSHEVIVFVEDEEGRRVLSPELERVWSLHDRLASDGMACVGKHVRGRLALVSLGVLPHLYALTGRPGRPDDFRDAEVLSPLELELAEALLVSGPRTGPDLRRLLGLRDAKAAKRALEALQRLLVVTRAGEADQAQGWSAAIFDLVARRYRDRLRRLPPVEEARSELADAVLRPAGELSAADLAAVFGFARRDAAAALDGLVERGKAHRSEEDSVPLWRPRRSRPR